MDIVFLSNRPDYSLLRVGSHHLAHRLSTAGHRVMHVSMPISRTELILRRQWKSRRQVLGNPPLESGHVRLARGTQITADGVAHAQPRPIVPVRWRRDSRYFRSFLSREGFAHPTVVFIDELHLIPLARAVSPGAVLVYRPVDSAHEGLGTRLEAELLQIVDGVAACSPFVLQEIKSRGYDGPAAVFENGVDDRFLEEDESAEAAREGAVYVGAMDSRFSWDFVENLALARPDISLTLVGPVMGDTRELPGNVVVRGPVPYEELPTVLRAHKVGILPLGPSQYNRGRSPMKYYEYLAAGLYVVAGWSETLAARGDVPGVVLYRDDEEGASAVGQFVSRAEANDEGREAARSRTWSTIAMDLLDFALGLRAPGVPETKTAEVRSRKSDGEAQ